MPASTSSHPQWRTFELRCTSDKQCTVLTFLNKDLRSQNLIKELEFEFIKLNGVIKTPHLVIDFSGVESAPSAIFGLVLEAAMTARGKGISVRVCSLAPVMQRAFELLSAKEFVEIVDDVRKACSMPWDKKKKTWWPF